MKTIPAIFKLNEGHGEGNTFCCLIEQRRNAEFFVNRWNRMERESGGTRRLFVKDLPVAEDPTSAFGMIRDAGVD